MAAATEIPTLREPHALAAAPAASYNKQHLQLPGKGKWPHSPTGMENTPAVCASKRPCVQLSKARGPWHRLQQEDRMIRSIR